MGNGTARTLNIHWKIARDEIPQVPAQWGKLAVKFKPRVEDAKQLTPQGVKLAADLMAAARWSDSPFAKIPKQYRMSSGDKDVDAWNEFADCALRDSGGVSPMELAAIRGDKELWAYLEGRGSEAADPPLDLQMVGRLAGTWRGARADIRRGSFPLQHMLRV